MAIGSGVPIVLTATSEGERREKTSRALALAGGVRDTGGRSRYDGR